MPIAGLLALFHRHLAQGRPALVLDVACGNNAKVKEFRRRKRESEP
jgi:hypothetical protein